MNKEEGTTQKNRKKKSKPSSEDESAQLAAAVQYAVIQLCCADQQNTSKSSQMSPKAIAALAELTYLYATTSLSADLDAFSSHAGRKTITEADVKLAVRKNSNVMEKLQEFCANQGVGTNSSGTNALNSKRFEDSASTKRKGGNSGASTIFDSRNTEEVVSLLQDDADAEESVMSVAASSSSSDEDDGLLARVQKQTAARVQSMLAARRSAQEADDASTSSEELMLPRKTTASPKRRRRKDSLDDSSDDDSLGSDNRAHTGNKTKPTAPKSRFRLPQSTNASLEKESRSRRNKLLDRKLPPILGNDRPSSSRVSQILADMSSQDSLFDDRTVTLGKENAHDQVE